MEIEQKKGKIKKYPLFGSMTRLRNYKVKIADLPMDLQNSIESWQNRKPKPYKYDEKTEFGKECLKISNELNAWINENRVHKSVGNENLKLGNTSLSDEKEITKTLQASESMDFDSNKGKSIETTEGRVEEISSETPQILSTVLTTDTQNTINDEQELTNEQKAVKIQEITENPNTPTQKSTEKPQTKKVNQKSIKSQSKQPRILSENEQILKNFYDSGVEYLKKSTLKNYNIPLNYKGDAYALSFVFWSWNYSYKIIKTKKQ